MRPLVVTTFLTLDGVMQAPGGPDEDRSGDFPYGGWLPPYVDEDFGRQIDAWFGGAQDFLLGRNTYETFAAFWSQVPPEANNVAGGLNTKTKHVASRTLTSVDWTGARLIEGDVVEAVQKLKTEDGGELQVHGSAGLIQTLLQHDLVDELRLIVFPVTVGRGKRLFGEGTPPRAWRLSASKATSTGALLLSYQFVGDLQIGEVTLEDEQGAPAA